MRSELSCGVKRVKAELLAADYRALYSSRDESHRSFDLRGRGHNGRTADGSAAHRRAPDGPIGREVLRIVEQNRAQALVPEYDRQSRGDGGAGGGSVACHARRVNEEELRRRVLSLRDSPPLLERVVFELTPVS